MYTISELGTLVGAEIVGDENVRIARIRPLEVAEQGDMSFFTEPRFLTLASRSPASALITAHRIEAFGGVQLVVAHPMLAVARLVAMMNPLRHTRAGQEQSSPIPSSSWVDPSAVIYPGVYIDEHVSVGAKVVLYPGVFLGLGVQVGEGSILYPGAILMAGTKVGKDCVIHPNVVLGGDGFGFVPTKEGHVKIPQIGAVEVEDEVEIGSLTSIDRATFTTTRIGSGTKIDSLVQLGHNVQVGQKCIICGQAGIAGSTKLGDGCVLAGQAGVAHGLELGDGVIVGPQAGVIGSLKAPGEYMGLPARPRAEWNRQMVRVKNLEKLAEEIKELKARVQELEGRTP